MHGVLKTAGVELLACLRQSYKLLKHMCILEKKKLSEKNNTAYILHVKGRSVFVYIILRHANGNIKTYNTILWYCNDSYMSYNCI
jgi:hypothetical protein